MALAIAEAGGMSSNDFERGLIDAFLVKAFLLTSGLVWKIKIPKPLRGRRALYLDSSLAKGMNIAYDKGYKGGFWQIFSPFDYFHGSHKVQKERFIAIISCQHQLKDIGICKPLPMEDWSTDKPIHLTKANGIASLFLSG